MLRNRATSDTYLVLLFTLYLKEDVAEDGSLKPAALAATREDKEMARQSGKISGDDAAGSSTGQPDGGEAAEAAGAKKEEDYEEARKHFEKLGVSKSHDDAKGAGGDGDDVD